MAKYRAFDDGMSIQCVGDGYEPVAGDAMFDHVPDGGELAAAFPARAPRVLAGQALVSARAALAASDITVLRCYEAGVALPAAWRDYRTALRAIVGGNGATSVPDRPDYPAGT